MTLLRGGRTASTVMAVVAALAMLLVLGPVPAQAGEGRLEFSRDGTTWTSAPQGALFDSGVMLVPGGSAIATLQVRSTAESPGLLSTSVTNVRTSGPEAEEHFGLRASTVAGTGIGANGVGLERTRVADLEDPTLLGPPLMLEPGQSATLTLTIDLDLRPNGTGAQNSAIGLDLAISFVDAVAGGTAGPAVAGGSAGPGVAGDSGGPGGPGGPGGEAAEGFEKPTILPIFPPDGDDERSGGAHHEVAPDGGATEGQRAAAEPVRAGTEADGTDRGLLAITGISRSAIIAAGTVTLVGAVLLFAARTRRTSDARRERSEGSGS